MHITVNDDELILIILITPGAISLVFGIISLLFRRKSHPIFPWGVVFLISMLAIACITISVWEGAGVTGSVILTLLPAIAAILIIKRGKDDDWSVGGYIGAIVVGVIIFSIVGGIAMDNSENYSMLAFVFFALTYIPGIIMVCKAERQSKY